MAETEPNNEDRAEVQLLMASVLDGIGAFDASNDEARDRSYVEAHLLRALADARTRAVAPVPGSLRVLRLLEYVYPGAEAMTKDMANWQVQGTYRPRAGFLIRTAVLPPEVLG